MALSGIPTLDILVAAVCLKACSRQFTCCPRSSGPQLVVDREIDLLGLAGRVGVSIAREFRGDVQGVSR